MVNFGPLMAEIGSGVWGTPANFNGFRAWLCYCSDVTDSRPTKPCTTFVRLMGMLPHVHYLYIFGSSCPLTEFCQVQNSLCIPSLAFSYIGSVTARHSSSRRQPKFAACYKEWNCGTFAEGATYIRPGGHHVGYRPTFWLHLKRIVSGNSLVKDMVYS